MEGYKLIKVTYLGEKKIVGVFFNSTQNYEIFEKEVKKVFNIANEICIFSSGFLIVFLQQIKQIPVIKSLIFTHSDHCLENKEQIAKAIVFSILNVNPDRRNLRDDLFELTKSILNIFPSEVAATYYVPYSKGHLAKGKLFDAYNNAKVKLNTAGVINRRINAKETK